MKLEEIRAIAERVKSQLAPHCIRCEIAGSIRRQKPGPRDIEIVAIPKPYETGLFASGIAPIVEQWEKVKGELGPECRYTQRVLPEGVKLDLFFATPENWGVQFAIRTGSAEFSHKVLAVRWSHLGYVSEGGILKRAGKEVFCREEKDLFELLGLEYIEPEKRNL